MCGLETDETQPTQGRDLYARCGRQFLNSKSGNQAMRLRSGATVDGAMLTWLSYAPEGRQIVAFRKGSKVSAFASVKCVGVSNDRPVPDLGDFVPKIVTRYKKRDALFVRLLQTGIISSPSHSSCAFLLVFGVAECLCLESRDCVSLTTKGYAQGLLEESISAARQFACFLLGLRCPRVRRLKPC